MSDNKKYYYLKLKEDFFDNEEMKVLESMKNGVEYQNVYLKMCLLSLKSDGALLFKNMLPYSIEMLSSVLRVNIDTIKTAVEIFQKIGLITVTDTETIYMTDIQTLVGQSSTEAERVKRYRQNLAQKKLEQIEAPSDDDERTNVVQMYETCTENVQNCTPEIRDKSIEIRDKNLNISSEESEDVVSDKSSKRKNGITKTQERIQYLSTLPEQIQIDSKKITDFLIDSRKLLDEKFSAKENVYVCWQVQFADFFIKSERSYSEVQKTLLWAFNSTCYKYAASKPETFIDKYEDIYVLAMQSKDIELKKNNVSKNQPGFYKNFDKDSLKSKDFFSGIEEYRNGTPDKNNERYVS